ncbi:hypothetical protein DMB65_03655 [Flavobacterium cheongpyeongense]|uniref:Uncharacterized protein n=1 Tax=Flavobacterium cheongpyeongense TaxID=2212651 RepID=A0A2V4BTH3_9FLAO|nr:hypothetical protein [Flavobacterium cheongpyeongense]PXY42336.1 hypothetical protein DMB65_03655 [Flavobacterium cheongpyeongense]
MNKIFILSIIFFTNVSYSQLFEGQKFCEESKDLSYFPILIHKKKIFWRNTFYFETKSETKILNGKVYTEFKQEWNNSNTDLLYLREENGIVYQYDKCCKNETIRYNPKFKTGDTWVSENKEMVYKIITYDGKLKTPYCEYQNLLVIEAKMKSVTFNFYYLRGHGYIGATQNDKLISCISPEW